MAKIGSSGEIPAVSSVQRWIASLAASRNDFFAFAEVFLNSLYSASSRTVCTIFLVIYFQTRKRMLKSILCDIHHKFADYLDGVLVSFNESVQFFRLFSIAVALKL